MRTLPSLPIIARKSIGIIFVPFKFKRFNRLFLCTQPTISENWDDDDNDIFASIILDQNEKINNFLNISKFQVNKQIIQGFQTANGKKISISEESKISIQNILREFHDDLQETDYETELKDIKARILNKSMESKFRTTATRKRLMALNDESNQTGYSTLNVQKFRKKHLLSLNPKFNFK
ncbi:hypothetical protein GQX74_004213 [Glossina fuscipes]|nr:hypothetical protein GQX74_004213 [Glossina fuscipes]